MAGRGERRRENAGRRPARRSVGRARRLDRLRDGHRRGARRRAASRRAGRSSISTAAGGGCPRPSTRRPARRRLRRPGGARRARARSPSGPPSTAWPGATRRPVVFIALHGPFGEDGTVQALLEAAGLAYTGVGRRGLGDRAWTRPSSSGCAAGSGLPVVDWREVRRRAGRATATRVLGELEAFAAGRRRPAPDGQAGAARQLGRDDPRPRRRASCDARPRRRLPLRRRWPSPRRYLAGRPRPRGVGHRQRPGAPRALRPGRDRVAATSSTTTRPSTRPACPRPRPAPRSATASGPSIHKLARDAYRAIGAEGFARVDFLLAGEPIVLSEINTIPGFTPISLFPTLPAEGGYDFADVCRRIVELAARAPCRAAPAGALTARTCRDEPDGRPRGGTRPPRRPAAARAPTRSGAPRPACRRSGPGRSSRCSAVRRGHLRRRRLAGLRATRSSSIDGVRRTPTGRRSRRPSPTPAARTCSARDRPARGAPCRDAARPSARPRVDVAPARHARRHARGARADPRLAGRRARFLVDAEGRLFAPLGDEPPAEARRRCRSSTTARAASAGLAVGARLDRRSTSTPRPGWPRSCPPTSAAPPSALAVSVTDENGFVVGHGRRLVGRLRLLHAEPAHARAHPGPGPAAAQPARRARAARRAGRSSPRRPTGPTSQADARRRRPSRRRRPMSRRTGGVASCARPSPVG